MKYSYDRTVTAAPKTHVLNFSEITTKARNAIEALDEKFFDTDDYMGVAFFWNPKYKWWLRDVGPKVRRKVHEAFRKANLPIDEYSDEHKEIIVKFFPDAKKRLEEMDED